MLQERWGTRTQYNSGGCAMRVNRRRRRERLSVVPLLAALASCASGSSVPSAGESLPEASDAGIPTPLGSPGHDGETGPTVPLSEVSQSDASTTPATSVEQDHVEEAADAFCRGALGGADPCAAQNGCELALARDCSAVVQHLNRDWLEAQSTCVDGDGSVDPICTVEALSALQPSDAQREFADAYCGQCVGLLGDSCQGVFFDPMTGEPTIAGAVLLPFGDEIAHKATEECTSGLTCAIDIADCLERVLKEQGLAEETVACLVGDLSLAAPATSPVDAGTEGACGAP